MDRSKNVAGAAAMVLACVFVVSSAAAGEPAPAYGEVRTENIKFDDLNLATTAGVDALHKRIQAAANRVCAVSSDHHLYQADSAASKKCSKEALARAVKELNLPELTAFAATR
jgi:UrcA family protein